MRGKAEKGRAAGEAATVSKELLALGNVISAATADAWKHVPYRNSLLTRVLQASLRISRAPGPRYQGSSKSSEGKCAGEVFALSMTTNLALIAPWAAPTTAKSLDIGLKYDLQ